MKMPSRIALGLMFVILSGTLFVSTALAAKAPPQKYYTKVNIWYENPEDISTTNYHKGAMLSAGSPIEITGLGKGTIRFYDIKTGTKFELVQVKKYMSITLNELFERYFSRDPVLEGASYAKFSPMEKENIRVGSLAVGMSREAVIMAYGYPPTHRTATLDAATWTYWKSRFSDFQIQFDSNGKVASIEQ
jgi:hypothetical protein